MLPQAYTACPKCEAMAGPGLLECPACGVVFAKVARAAAGTTVPPDPEPGSGTPAHGGLEASILAGPLFWGRVAGLLTLSWLTWRMAPVPFGPGVMDSFLHLPNLVFHEAGHVLFSPFGRFMTVLGGSLFQILLPALLAGAMYRERQPFGAAVCAWWTGQNLLDVAPYAADARALSLVLLGGKTGAEVEGHDWEYLLTALDLLHLDRAIGAWMHWTGVAIMLGAIAAAGLLLVRRQPAPPGTRRPSRRLPSAA